MKNINKNQEKSKCKSATYKRIITRTGKGLCPICRGFHGFYDFETHRWNNPDPWKIGFFVRKNKIVIYCQEHFKVVTF